MQILILDLHPMNDGRIERHIKYLVSQNFHVFHIHFNRSNPDLPPGIFSQFGETSYRINVTTKTNSIINSPLFFYFFYSTPFVLSKVRRMLQSLKIDQSSPIIIHVHDPVLNCVAVMLKSLLFKSAKIVYDRHEVNETLFKIWLLRLPLIPRIYEIVTRKYIDGVISISEEHNAVIQKLFPKARVTTVPNYPTVTEYTHKEIAKKIEDFQPSSDIKLVYIGSLSKNIDRDVDLILSVGEKVLRFYPNSTLRIGGSCKDPAIGNKFVLLKKEFVERFEYLGETSRQKTIDLTQKSHIGFFLIRPDTDYWVRSSPNKVYEYLICGTIPIIRANIDHSEEMANCSLLFSRESSEEEIIKKSLELIRDPVRMKKMMEEALNISNKFTFESMEKNYDLLYASLLS